MITADSKRVCAVRFITSQWKLMVMCVYMPYEDGEARTDDFVDQLRCIECLVNDNYPRRILIIQGGIPRSLNSLNSLQ